MIKRLETPEIIRRSNWTALNEDMPRREVKCQFTSKDWEKLVESEVYNDLISMGWEEITTPFRKSMGNIVFYHERFFPWDDYRINRNGLIVVSDKRTENQKTLITKEETIYGRECATISDYVRKMDFLMKLTLQKMLNTKNSSIISADELVTQTSYKDQLRQKLSEDPIGIVRRRMEFVPASMIDELR